MPLAPDILPLLASGSPLSESQSEHAFTEILSGQVPDTDIAALLTHIANRTGGPTTNELVGGARALRSHLAPVPLPKATAALIDTCGTGGAPKLFNISTAGAIVTAAAAPGRVLVAKHGSLSRTGRGSAEVLQALGVNIANSPATQTRCLEQIGLCFSFAVHHHPAMKHVAPIRKALGFPTIFNLLGPLANPAGARRQLIGTYSDDLAEKLAQALARLGVDRALVVTTRDGLDELTITDINILRLIGGNTITRSELDATTLGLPRASIDQLQARTLDEAAHLVRDTVAGVPGPALDMVLLNAAASLFVAGVVEDIAEGLTLARRAVTSGAATRTLADLIRLSNI